MNITRFAVHVVSNGVLVATVTGQEHVVGQFAESISELVCGFEGCAVNRDILTTSMVATMHNAVRQSDTRRTVIPAGHRLEVVITPMFSAIGGV